MYIGLKNIQYTLKNFSTLLTKSDGIHCLTGWEKLSYAPKPYSDHLLYVHDAAVPMDKSTLDPHMHLVYIVDEGVDMHEVMYEFPEGLSLLIVACNNPTLVHTELQNYFNIQCGVSLFGQTLLEFLSFEDGLQPAIEYSYNIFRNPVFVFDGNYNLIAATWEAIEKLGIEDDVILNKRFSDQDFKMASRMNNLHKKVQHSEVPIRDFNEELGYEQMYCAISTQKDMGHIVISAINKPFDPIDSELMLTLKKYVVQQVRKDDFIRSSRGFNHEYFLRDLLDKRIAVDRSNLSRMDYVANEFSGNMYCLVIETARSISTINAISIRNMLESRFSNSKTLIYNGQVIAIFSAAKHQLLPDEYRHTAKKMCKENGLYAGLSNCFQDIMQFEAYYLQALRAIELGISQINEPNLFCYEDYCIDHVKNIFKQTESADIFCHPKIKFLLDYDNKYNSELAYTLYMYLINERNLVSAAEAMNMHRTSLIYRFKKIHMLIGDDFEDFRERMYMILSYEMMT